MRIGEGVSGHSNFILKVWTSLWPSTAKGMLIERVVGCVHQVQQVGSVSEA